MEQNTNTPAVTLTGAQAKVWNECRKDIANLRVTLLDAFGDLNADAETVEERSNILYSLAHYKRLLDAVADEVH